MLLLVSQLLFIAGIGRAEIQLILLLLYIIPQVFYILNLHSLIMKVSVENRKIQPVLLWLAIIPFIGLVWQFYIVSKMAESLRLEFDKRQIENQHQKPGFALGLAYCILLCCGIIPVLGVVLCSISLFFWISYWVKMNGYKKLL